MEMWTGDAPGRTHGTDDCALCNGVAYLHELPTEMQICSHDTLAVIDIDDIPTEVKRTNKSHNAAIGSPYRCANNACEIGAHVTTGDCPVERSPATEAAGNSRRSRGRECAGPQARRVMRVS